MFPGNFNIPGHSGTDQKNRKAFDKSRNRQKQTAYSYEGTKRSAERSGRFKHNYQYGKLSRRLIFTIGVPMVLAAVIGAGMILFSIGDSIINNQYSQPTIVELDRDDAYNFYTRIGGRWLLAGDFEEARANFGKALEIAPYGQNARFALTEVLESICREQGRYCEEAKAQRDFIVGMGWKQNELLSDQEPTSSY